MRWAKSYSIVDHRLLHGGYFQKLSHEALVLYLFLIVVGDKNGRSFYADRSIEGILRLTQLCHARSELIQWNLIDYRGPYWWVKNIHERSQTKSEGTVSQRCSGPLLSSDPRPIGDLTQESLQTLQKFFNNESDENKKNIHP